MWSVHWAANAARDGLPHGMESGSDDNGTSLWWLAVSDYWRIHRNFQMMIDEEEEEDEDAVCGLVKIEDGVDLDEEK